jgi:ATP-dependent DNA ligase
MHPMLARKQVDSDVLEACILDDTFVIQRKFDGERVLIRVFEGAVTDQWGRNGAARVRSKGKFHTGLMLEGFSKLDPVKEYFFDGELMPDGKFNCFDIVLDSVPFIERHDMLHSIVLQMGITSEFDIAWCARDEDLKLAMVVTAIRERGWEGLMIRKAGSLYEHGRSHNVMKWKKKLTVDVVAIDRHPTKDSYSIGLWKTDNSSIGINIVLVGNVSILGKEKDSPIVSGDVLEVQYANVGVNGDLVQPRIMAIRSDKDSVECTLEQLSKDGYRK